MHRQQAHKRPVRPSTPLDKEPKPVADLPSPPAAGASELLLSPPSTSAATPSSANSSSGSDSAHKIKRTRLPLALNDPFNKNLKRRNIDKAMEEIFRHSESPSSSSRLYKILVIGEVHCGKSALIRRYVHDFFSENYRSTVGVDFQVKIIPHNEELEIRLQLWDIAGQERFSQMTRAYFKGAMGALILFDLSHSASFEAVSRWKKDLDSKCYLPDGKRVPAILVANKSDLKRDKNLPDDVQISQFVQEAGFVPKWFKTSALTGEGIEDSMNLLVRYIMAMDSWNKPLINPYPDEDDNKSTLRLRTTVKLDKDKQPQQETKKAGCLC